VNRPKNWKGVKFFFPNFSGFPRKGLGPPREPALPIPPWAAGFAGPREGWVALPLETQAQFPYSNGLTPGFQLPGRQMFGGLNCAPCRLIQRGGAVAFPGPPREEERAPGKFGNPKNGPWKFLELAAPFPRKHPFGGKPKVSLGPPGGFFFGRGKNRKNRGFALGPPALGPRCSSQGG